MKKRKKEKKKLVSSITHGNGTKEIRKIEYIIFPNTIYIIITRRKVMTSIKYLV